MDDTRSRLGRLFHSLSARLLVLTIFFVMLSEVLIYAPSVARYRQVYMEERVAAAHFASLALDAPPGHVVSPTLMEELLDHARSHGIVLRKPASKALMLSKDMPPTVEATFDLRDTNFFTLIGDSFAALSHDDNRFIRVIGVSPKDPNTLVETVIEETPLRAEMYAFSKRILGLSIVISLITASLVYLALHWMFVRPMVAITESMVAFRRDPENTNSMIVPGRRRDEIGHAQRELADMQRGLRDALQQRARLAALGTAVTKINHDLRNILATTQIVSDGLATSDDPKVKKLAPRLFRAIDRAVGLCTQTLNFAHQGTPPPELRRLDLHGLARDIGAELVEYRDGKVTFDNRIAEKFNVVADRDQIYRVLLNLILNAFEAGATHVRVSASRLDEWIEIDVVDNGPGLPLRVRENLFRAFAGSGRAGGTGLGLAIARDLLRGHGGDIELASTGADGTDFRLRLPAQPKRAGRAPDRQADRRPVS